MIMESSDKIAESTTPDSSVGGDTTSEKQPLATATSEPSTTVKSANTVNQSHMSTAQNVFSGRPTAGLMCNNLRANPFSVSDNSASSSGLLAKPKFSLKPSAFASTGDASGAESGTTAVVSNPFLRPATLNYDNDDDTSNGKIATQQSSEKSTDEKPANSDNGVKEVVESSKDSEANVTSDKTSADSTSSIQASTLAASTSAFTSNIVRASQSSFVFGEALDSRVTNVAKENGTNGHSDPDEIQKPKMLTLEEAADEYKKQQESGPILPEVDTVTGEEEESNVLQISCKLFLFQDKSKTWSERGRGCLRLNDEPEGIHSRVVMRTAGIHRVILNTNIWPGMICERANLKSIRITGMESEQVHVYLITGSAADIDHLHNAVTYRIQRLKQHTSPAVSITTGNSADGDAASMKRKTEEDSETTPKRLKTEERETTVE